MNCQLNTELSILTLRFSQNLLKETNNYELALTEKQLEGLPESSLESYAQTAKDKGKEGSIITLDAPSFVPFMKYCDDRSLRREVYMARSIARRTHACPTRFHQILLLSAAQDSTQDILLWKWSV